MELYNALKLIGFEQLVGLLLLLVIVVFGIGIGVFFYFKTINRLGFYLGKKLRAWKDAKHGR